MTVHQSIFKSDYDKFNFDVSKHGDELDVTLTYPPHTSDNNTGAKCRYVIVDQESVRASDGVRLHYDYERDGFVVEQPRPRLVKLSDDAYQDEMDWIEVGFFPSWKFNDREDCSPYQEEYDRADAIFEKEGEAP